MTSVLHYPGVTPGSTPEAGELPRGSYPVTTPGIFFNVKQFFERRMWRVSATFWGSLIVSATSFELKIIRWRRICVINKENPWQKFYIENRCVVVRGSYPGVRGPTFRTWFGTLMNVEVRTSAFWTLKNIDHRPSNVLRTFTCIDHRASELYRASTIDHPNSTVHRPSTIGLELKSCC